jgi:hypothetical protein
MSDRLRTGWALACAWGGAILWAVGLTILQPLTEPTKPWIGDVASNNTYWARDIRWMAIVVILVAFVLSCRGDRLLSLLGGLAAVGWFGADIVLDRRDVEGWAATGPVAAIACAVVAVGMLIARRRAHVPGTGVLIVAAAIAAALAPLAGIMESPTDTEAGLTPSAVAAGLLLAAVALGCALAIGPVSAERRLLAMGLGVATTVGVIGLRALQPGTRFSPMTFLAVVLFTGLSALVWHHPGRHRWGSYVGVAVATLLLYPAAVVTFHILMGIQIQIAGVFTALAGNPPVNAADSDTLVTLTGVLAGLGFGAVVAIVARTDERDASAHSSPPTP